MFDFNDCKRYLYLGYEEKKLVFKFVAIFSILFAFFASNLTSLSWLVLLFPVAAFVLFLITIHFLAYKFFSYLQGFEIHFQELAFNRFHLEPYETLENRNVKPIKYSILSVFIALLSIGFIIYSSVFTYSHKKIDYLFIGKRKEFEYSQGNLYPQENTQLRQAYSHFFTNTFLVVLIVILSLLPNIALVNAFLLILISYSFFTLLPIIPTIGFQYFIQHTYLWSASFALLVIFSLYSLIFTSITAFILLSIVTALIVLLTVFIKFINSV